MKNHKEFAHEVLRRANIIKRHKNARKVRICSALSALACLVLIVILPFFLPSVPDASVMEASGAASAAMLADAGIGGYALIGVTGFVLGVAVTLLSVKKIRKD